MIFLGGSDSKEFVCIARDPGSIPGWGTCTGERNGNPLQYSCLENSMDRGARWATVHGVTKSRTLLRQTFSLSFIYPTKFPRVALLLGNIIAYCFGHVFQFQFSHSVVSDSLQPHKLQHARPPCPSLTPGVHPNPYPLSR